MYIYIYTDIQIHTYTHTQSRYTSCIGTSPAMECHVAAASEPGIKRRCSRLGLGLRASRWGNQHDTLIVFGYWNPDRIAKVHLYLQQDSGLRRRMS